MGGRHAIGWCLVIGGLLGLSARTASAQLSPGPLARAHASLEGTRQCLTCHPVGRKEAMDGACLACHREIAWLRGQGRGLHAKEAKARCASCHPDHLGGDFALVAWTADSLPRFDHARAGWVLVDGHRKVKCDECHAPRFRTGPAARLAPDGAKGRWVGFERSCTSCHADVHRGRFRADCTECHDLRGWVPAPRFDHAQTEYVLTGKHGTVECQKCHAPRPAGMLTGTGALDPAFPPLRFAECASCHQDPHAGRLGSRCSGCHVTTSFFDRGAGARFDHSRTRYPLEGRHTTVKCEGCHARGPSRAAPVFATCESCHRAAHARAWATLPPAVECAACHTVIGFKPSTYTSAQHRAGRCTECHAEVHGTQQPGAPALADCARCHGTEDWFESAYAAVDHATTGLPLEGRHAAVACGACHGLERRDLPAMTKAAADGRVGVRFRVGGVACGSCHRDVHQARYGATCSECHGATAWRPASMTPAEHARRGFALAGAHLAVACADCHTALPPAGSGSALIQGAAVVAPALATKGTGCAACHADPHGAQFAPRDCTACHGEDGFRPAPRFDHAQSSFDLAGAHAQVKCSQCHTAPTSGQPVRYRGVPRRCEACHAAGTPRARPGGRP